MMCIQQCLAAPRLLPHTRLLPCQLAASCWFVVFHFHGEWRRGRKKKKRGEKKMRKKIKVRDYLFTFTLLSFNPLIENTNITFVVYLFANQQGAN